MSRVLRIEYPGAYYWNRKGVRPFFRTFTIALARRQTFWRYYVFDPSQPGASEEDCQIIGKSQRGRTVDGADATDIQFTRREEPV